MRRANAAWLALGVVAALIALAGVARWFWAVSLDGPVLYGEGAVAHAAILARERLEYAAGASYGGTSPIFTAANYPPLFFHLAGLGDPFVTGRLLSIGATLVVALAIAWRARTGGWATASALALGWLATLPVVVWGAALKPDLVALAFTVGGVLAVDARRPLVAGALLALAVSAKPTALLPAAGLAVPVLYTWGVGGVVAYLAAGVVAGLLVGIATRLPDNAMYVHAVDWNALAWHPDQAAQLALVGIIAIGVPALTLVLYRRAVTPAPAAYVVAGLAILFLGGREGATINYLLDLSAASALALAAIASLLRSGSILPLAFAGQLVLALALFNPLGFALGRAPGTGAWADPARLATMRTLPDPALVEDSGLLVASGREPVVDDLFLWSRLLDRGAMFSEGRALLDAVGARRFARIVSEADLEHLDEAPGYERQRWAAALVREVLDRYRLERREGALWIYVPR